MVNRVATSGEAIEFLGQATAMKLPSSGTAGKPPMAILKDPASAVLVAGIFPQFHEFTREDFLRIDQRG